MDCQDFSFGSFSTDETSDLFTQETRDLQFVWQASHRVYNNLDNDYTPLKSKLLDVSACIDHRDRRSYSPGALSPNIPPNPPTSPVDDLAGGDQRRSLGSRKLNVNAMPFVPGGPPKLVLEVNNSSARHLDFSGEDGGKMGCVDVQEGMDEVAGSGAEGRDGGGVGESKDYAATSAESATAGVDCKLEDAESAEHVVESADSAGVDRPEKSAGGEEDQMPWPNLLSVQTAGQVTAASRTASDVNRTETVVTCEAGQDNIESLAESSGGEASHCPGNEECGLSPNSIESPPSGVTMATTPEGAGRPHSGSPVAPSSQSGGEDLNSDPTPALLNHDQHRTNVSKTASTRSSTTPTFEPVQTKTSRESTPTSPSSTDLMSPRDKEGVISSPESVLNSNNNPAEINATPTVGVTCKAPVKSWASIVSRTPADVSPVAHNPLKSTSGGHAHSTSGLQTRTNGQKPSDRAPRPVVADPEGVKAGVEGVKANGVGSRGGGGVALKGKEAEKDRREGYCQFRMLGEQLAKWSVSHRRSPVLPRGLINVGNWCYMHAPLQALLSVPAVRNLFQSLNPNPPLSKGPSATPFMDAMIQFVHEFRDYPKTSASNSSSNLRRKRSQMGELLSGDPFRPEYVYTMLHNIRSNLSYKGRQEDAEEFLGCLLDGLHEEIVSANKSMLDTDAEDKVSGVTDEEGSVPSSPEGVVAVPGNGREGGAEEGEEWEQVGPKNKSTITRQISFSESPITEIFGGKLRSCLHRLGAKESATLEPFFSLQLDIQSDTITSVKEALDALVAKETVSISEVDVHKRLTLARLPPVLIFHLKRFIFTSTSTGSQKLFKHIHYTTEMELAKELLAPAIKTKLSQAQRTYRLWAVVYHHGKTATGGHYTSDVYHSGYGGWVRMDDNLLKPIPDDFVLTPGSGIQNKNAYLLFYRRADTVRDS